MNSQQAGLSQIRNFPQKNNPATVVQIAEFAAVSPKSSKSDNLAEYHFV
jgi:hypothetical protein